MVEQRGSALAQPIQRKRWARTVAQEPLQAGAVLLLGADAGVDRKRKFQCRPSCTQVMPQLENAVLEGQHLAGLAALDQATARERARMRVCTSACAWATAAASSPLAG